VVEQALADHRRPATGAAAWTTIGRMRLAAGDTPAPLEAARRGQALQPALRRPAMLALELMDPKQPQAEAMVRKYLQGQPMPELRMGYARALLDAQRYPEALQQLQVVTTERPTSPRPGWCRARCWRRTTSCRPAEASLKKYVELAQATQGGEERKRGLAQAYLRWRRSPRSARTSTPPTPGWTASRTRRT
jgi:predicted Zn-dependent protease